MDICLDNSLNIAFNAECDNIAQKLVEANNCRDIQPNFDIFSDSIIDLISEEGISTGNDHTYCKIPVDDVVKNKLEEANRFKELSEQELDAFAEANTEASTKLATIWAVTQFRGALLIVLILSFFRKKKNLVSI